ncbi:Mannan endo-1,4-beta-mannosidase 1 [Chlorella sorokiniana]|uniref:mannan endo-1,4-beta-mannosidase n=1 Tax=Chlorella sorokiniana TaxID=3076 RepID=A0A2P6TRE7_CHLSO|nr:Mannan endo-1,4-beta-mannosidase 1 [Chlorella sorokiniana]|eukprot:PRW56628.1 Mannan endo-1,4-beta-mannosidase 1 [Chlorella sorokiniana]
MHPGGFVRVSGDRLRLVEADGSPYYFCGANCYYLLTRAADPATRHECTAVLDDAAAAGITVLRTWAFADGEQWSALQTRPGVYEERTFQALDWVIAEAGWRGLRLLLNLTNYWKDYGGMRQYVQWAYQARGQQPPIDGSGQVAAEPFYTDPDCQRMFKANMAAVVRRVNSLTGVRYSDDPAILAWGLANEPRGDRACTVVPFWADAMARHLKSLDPHHLVTLDVEGFLGPSTPDEAARSNPYNCAGSGCDFAADCGSPAIDFACAHMYPDLWLPQADDQERLHFALCWVDCHVALARRLGKPLVLSEWGKQRSVGGEAAATGGSPRAAFYAQVLGRSVQHMQAGGLAGTAVWMMAAPSYPDHDRFTVYLSSRQPGGSSVAGGGGGSQAGPAPQPRPGERTAAVIRQHAATVAMLNGRPEIANGQMPYLAQPLVSGPSAGSIGGAGLGSGGAAPHHHLPLPAVGGGHGQVVHSGSGGRGRFCYCYCCCPQM